MRKNILVITDNGIQYRRFLKLVSNNETYSRYKFEFRRSFLSGKNKMYEKNLHNLKEIDVNKSLPTIVADFDLVISLHCKQFFSSQLVNSVKCINIHPGYNPANRGWYPQVFAISNENIIGATIHEIDEKLDHGAIIAREKCAIYSWDTSFEVYERVLELEMKLVSENLLKILEGDYRTITPEIDGKLYLLKDFNELCHIDLNEEGTFKTFINRLRALSHGDYKNAYFFDDNGNKIYLSISLDKL